MSYLTTYNLTFFNESYNDFIEECLVRSYNNDDAYLLEYCILNELSNQTIFSAGDKVLQNIYKLKGRHDNISLDKPDNYDSEGLSNKADDLENFLNSFKKNGPHKRKRIINHILNSPSSATFIKHIKTNGTDKEYEMPIASIKHDLDRMHCETKLDDDEVANAFIKDKENEINELKQQIEKSSTLSNKIKRKIKNIKESLQRKYNDFKKKYNNSPPEKRTIIQKILFRITKIIDWLISLLKRK